MVSRCSDCGGSGVVQRVRQTLLGHIVSPVVCQRCQGLGEAITDPCPSCRGQGRVIGKSTIAVEVPAGVDHGSTLRLTGKGAAGPRGGQPGDLYVHLSVVPHPTISRSENDLLQEVHISMTQAALGATVGIETFDGNREIQVQPGSQTGTSVRMRGIGVPHLRGRGRGDLVATFLVDTPDALDKEQEQLLRQLASLRGEKVAEPEEGLISRIRSAFN